MCDEQVSQDKLDEDKFYSKRLVRTQKNIVNDANVYDRKQELSSCPKKQSQVGINIRRQNYPLNRHNLSSIFSSKSGTQNYRGFINLAFLILVAANFRLVIENILKYGILLNKKNVVSYLKLEILIWIVIIPIFALLALILEKIANKYRNYDLMVFSILILLLLVAIPIYVVLSTPPSPASGILLLFSVLVSWLKLYSYIFANRQFRIDATNNFVVPEKIDNLYESEIISYPNNLTIQNLIYFMFAPTLCYQLNYPISRNIRWFWLINKIFQLIFFMCLIVFLFEQYCLPIVRNSYLVLKDKQLVHITERILKLSIPSLYLWLCSFYAVFHLYPNILAELLHFGDREFYGDWWNATNFQYYWRTWNIPTHNWLVRHVYLPLIRKGFSKKVATIIVFLFSATAHEIVVSIPLHTRKFYFFVGMISQIPATYLGNFFNGTVLGNIVFWTTFCFFGQPIGVLMYWFDFTTKTISQCDNI